MPSEAPIFTTTHDLLNWLTPHLETWPRPQRFLLAKQVMDSATQFYRLLVRARKVSGAERAQTLLNADVELETLKVLLRLGEERQYMSVRQYAHVSTLVMQIGQQLGGWRKTMPRPTAQ